MAGASKVHLSAKNKETFVPQAPSTSTSIIPTDSHFEDIIPVHISDQPPQLTEAVCSPSNTSTYWTNILQVESNYLDTLQRDLYLSSSNSSIEDKESIDPLNLDWDKLIVLDEWPTPMN